MFVRHQTKLVLEKKNTKHCQLSALFQAFPNCSLIFLSCACLWLDHQSRAIWLEADTVCEGQNVFVLKGASEWCHRASVKIGSLNSIMWWLSFDTAETCSIENNFKASCKSRVWSFSSKCVADKSANTKLTTAIGLWGNGQMKKSPPSPSYTSPPTSPTPSPSPSSPDKSPSLKSRFFNNYINNQRKESKGEEVCVAQHV